MVLLLMMLSLTLAYRLGNERTGEMEPRREGWVAARGLEGTARLHRELIKYLGPAQAFGRRE